MTLTEFLLARIAEDEALALQPWLPLLQDVDAWWNERDSDQLAALDEQGDDVKGLAKTIMQIEQARGAYARVLAEVEAKRRIVDSGASECGGYEDQEQFGSHHYPDPEWSHCDGCAAAESSDRDWIWTLRVLALPYADHPDYRQAWAV